jgi:hypothetical protein
VADIKKERGQTDSRLKLLEKDDLTKRREWQNDLPHMQTHTTIVRARVPDEPVALTSDDIAKQTIAKLANQTKLNK